MILGLKRCKHRKKHRGTIFVTLLIVISVLLLLDHQLRPLIKSISADQARIISTNIINNAIIEELSSENIQYSDLVNIERDGSGKILAINTDVKKVNLLKSMIADKVQEKFSNTRIQKVKIPLGTLTGTEIFTGYGPPIRLKIALSGSIATDLKSSFSSAGINQTRHQIYLCAITKVFALIPGYPVTTAVETNMVIAETVIVGDVPRVYANVDDKDHI